METEKENMEGRQVRSRARDREHGGETENKKGDRDREQAGQTGYQWKQKQRRAGRLVVETETDNKEGRKVSSGKETEQAGQTG